MHLTMRGRVVTLTSHGSSFMFYLRNSDQSEFHYVCLHLFDFDRNVYELFSYSLFFREFDV